MRAKLLKAVVWNLTLGIVGCSGGSGDGVAAGGSGGGGNSSAVGGSTGNGGSIASGGAASGGNTGGGGVPSTGGAASGGTSSAGGASAGSGGAQSTGGSSAGKGGTTGAGGAQGSGGNTGVDAGTPVNCSATMPSGGTPHSGSSQGGTGNLVWSLWQNGSGGSITTFSTTAFSASWGPNSGDFLARIGLEWGNSGKTYDQYGNITAQFAYTKTGTGGGYSYIGIYGWSNSPCVEYYIVDDSYGTMPFNAYGGTLKGTAMIDGENYKLFQNNTNGSGGSRCSGGASSWLQFWSIRQKARQCGQISISQHFDAWKAVGMTLGSLLEAKILVEVGGGTGTMNFPIANVSAQ